MKSERDFNRIQPTQSGTSAGKAPVRSITTSAKSGQLVLEAKKKKKEIALASHTESHEVLKKKISHVRLGSKVMLNLRTPSGADLRDMTRFVKAWNDVDCPDGPSLSWDILQGLEESVAKLKDQLEVTSTYHPLSTHVHYRT